MCHTQKEMSQEIKKRPHKLPFGNFELWLRKQYKKSFNNTNVTWKFKITQDS